jgi:alkanesulfonate monooxygenase SsuD/methylene tetrahydromethanopterin reductase-like flavin-dependent oxidoreductase (luciferase family)
VTDYGHPLKFGTMIEPLPDRPLHALELADVTERAGLDVVRLPDHPYWPQWLDSFSLLAAIATRTERVGLFSNVANLPPRPPARWPARPPRCTCSAAGRFDLGLGTGAQQLWDGIVAEGGPRRNAKESVDALEEAVQVIRSLWSPGPTVDFTGRYYQVAGASTHPAAAGSVEIWLGAYQSRMLRLTGQVADGWIRSSPACPPAALGAANRIIDDAAAASGRSPASVRRGYNIEPEFSAEQLAELALTQGISVFLLYRAQSADLITRFAQEVVPAVRERVDAERGQ